MITIVTVVFLITSAILFMLIKTWFKNQFRFVAYKEYRIQPKDKLWTWAGWVCVLIFLLWLGCVLLEFYLLNRL